MPSSPTLGSLVDRRYKLREKRDALNKKLKELKAEEDELETQIFHELKEAEVTKATGRTAQVSIRRDMVPQLVDFDTFFAYAKRKGNTDLIQHSVKTTAWRERINDGKEVPGVQTFTRVSLSISKKGSK